MTPSGRSFAAWMAAMASGYISVSVCTSMEIASSLVMSKISRSASAVASSAVNPEPRVEISKIFSAAAVSLRRLAFSLMTAACPIGSVP